MTLLALAQRDTVRIGGVGGAMGSMAIRSNLLATREYGQPTAGAHAGVARPRSCGVRRHHPAGVAACWRHAARGRIHGIVPCIRPPCCTGGVQADHRRISRTYPDRARTTMYNPPPGRCPARADESPAATVISRYLQSDASCRPTAGEPGRCRVCGGLEPCGACDKHHAAATSMPGAGTPMTRARAGGGPIGRMAASGASTPSGGATDDHAQRSRSMTSGVPWIGWVAMITDTPNACSISAAVSTCAGGPLASTVPWASNTRWSA